MTKKVKLSDVARDLQIPTQELIGFYQERDEKGNTKKGTTCALELFGAQK